MIDFQLIVKQLSVIHSVCELAINPAFAQAPKQFGANEISAVTLLQDLTVLLVVHLVQAILVRK